MNIFLMEEVIECLLELDDERVNSKLIPRLRACRRDGERGLTKLIERQCDSEKKRVPMKLTQRT